MNTKNGSEALNAHLDGIVNPEIGNNLENLRGLIDPELFKSFEERILGIVENNPESAGIVDNELKKTEMLLEEEKPYYLRRVSNLAGVIANGGNLDDFFGRPAANNENFDLGKNNGDAANDGEFRKKA